jgi:cell division protein DivIC
MILNRFRIALAVLLLFVVVNSGYSLYDLWKRRDILKEREAVLTRLEAENLALKQSLEESQTDEFIEKEARDKLGLVKPGDTVLLLGGIPTASTTPIPVTPQKTPSFRTWWELFF